MSRPRNRVIVSAAACVATVILLAADATRAQEPIKPVADPSLLGLVPKQAFIVLERRGHDAVKAAYQASNFGKMCADDAIKGFAYETRDKVLAMMAKGVFGPAEGKEDAARQLLLQTLKPAWYCPTTLFLIAGPDEMDNTPGAGILCLTGKYKAETAKAVEKVINSLLKARLAKRATYTKGKTTWQVITDGDADLPADPAERDKALREQNGILLYCWVDQLICVATQVSVADAISETLADPSKSKAGSPLLRTVCDRTVIKDWAFRWFVDTEMIWKTMAADKPADGATAPATALTELGIDKVLAIGGTGGYVDNLYARRTYVYSPKADRGLTKLFKAGGSYKQAVAMTPPGCTFALAGQLDAKALMSIIRRLGFADADAEQTKKAETVLGPIEKLLAGADGHASLYLTDLQALMMIGRGGAPAGIVLHTSRPAQAQAAIDQLAKAIGEGPANGAANDDRRMKSYRKVAAQYLETDTFPFPVMIGVMDDRVIVAFGAQAFAAAVDAAKDKIGTFGPDSKGAHLLAKSGPGAAAFSFDLAKVASLAWPFLTQAATMAPDQFPLGTPPSTAKMVRMLGPEVAVIQPDATGLLLSSRGKIPFATKLPFHYMIVMGMMSGGF